MDRNSYLSKSFSVINGIVFYWQLTYSCSAFLYPPFCKTAAGQNWHVLWNWRQGMEHLPGEHLQMNQIWTVDTVSWKSIKITVKIVCVSLICSPQFIVVILACLIMACLCNRTAKQVFTIQKTFYMALFAALLLVDSAYTVHPTEKYYFDISTQQSMCRVCHTDISPS
jgi:hypothetical protein